MDTGNAFSTEIVQIQNPDGLNLIFGQSHFIKTIEDIHEAMVCAVPGIVFGAAFSEASGDRKIRLTGTDRALTELAKKNIKDIACGHVFLIFMKNAFPINVLPSLSRVPEIVRIFCATANPVQVLVARTGQGGGVLGVIDGHSPLTVETKKDRTGRLRFLRKLGYKLDV